MAEERPPFYYLDKLIRIIVVDDDPGVVRLVQDIFAPVRLYAVHTAANAREAEPLIASPDRIVLCILDMGLTDRDNDEFYLLKKYASRAAFVVFTGSVSPAKGFVAHQLGAKAVIEKSAQMRPVDFLRQINYHALVNIINPRYGRFNDTLTNSTDILFRTSPQFVSQWAIQMGISDRELRHIWTKNLGANAKIVLSIYQIFEAAFRYFERQAVHGGENSSGGMPSLATYRRLEEYFHCHKSTITDYIAFGNIALCL